MKNCLTVNVYNRQQVANVTPTPNTVVISVSAPNHPAQLQDGWEKVLRLEFHDIVEKWEEYEGLVPFNEEQAKILFDFIEENSGCSFVINCDAGMSRSVAVGKFICDTFGIHELILHAVGTTEFANTLITRLLNREIWRRIND